VLDEQLWRYTVAVSPLLLCLLFCSEHAFGLYGLIVPLIRLAAASCQINSDKPGASVMLLQIHLCGECCLAIGRACVLHNACSPTCVLLALMRKWLQY
jgi:hypothetical protein